VPEVTFGTQISWLKTKIQDLGWSVFPNVIVYGNLVDRVDEFTYLCRLQFSDGYYRTDIKCCVALTSSMMSLLDSIWHHQRLSLSTKTCIYPALALSVLLCAAETWIYSRNLDVKILEVFYFWCQHMDQVAR